MAPTTTLLIDLPPLPSQHHRIQDTDSYNEEHFSNPSNTTSQNNLRPITRHRQILVLISSFFTIFITIGFNQSYGVFQSYYTSPAQTMLPPSTSNQPALVAFVGTLGSGLTWAGSIFINPIMARLGPTGVRGIGVVGVLLMSLGFGLASFGSQVWHLLLTQGLLYGIGSSCLYFPILSAAPEYFNTNRGSAMGFILSGAGIGGLVLSPSIRALLTALGPRWTLRFMAFLNLVVSLPIAITASPSRFIGTRKTHLDLHLALKPLFIFSVLAAFLQAGGNGLPLTFISEYSVAVGFSASFGATLLAVNNGVNSISRITTGWAGDRFGRQNTLILTVLWCVLAVVGLWLGSVGRGGDRGLWVAFVVVYGFASGGYNALFPTVSTPRNYGNFAYNSM